MADRVNGGAQCGACARIRDFSKTVMHPQPLSSGANKPRTSKVRQVPRDRGLREPERLVDLTNAHFAVRQNAENPKPRRVRQGAVDPRKLMNSSHKCAGANVP